MASKNIKGITIEIGGNTTKLENALKDVNKVVYTTNNELKSLNNALKLDPKNTELLAQKQELLQKNGSGSTDNLSSGNRVIFSWVLVFSLSVQLSLLFSR